MKFSIRIFLASICAVFAMVLVSCDNNMAPLEPQASTGSLKLEFDNVVGDRDLKLDTDFYTNAAGERFNITAFNYYISNIKLIKSDGSSFTLPQDSSYFLVRENDIASQVLDLKNIPVGEYTGVEFMVGVDSLRSVSDASNRKGVLDPGYSEVMYWSWNSGYIFMKMEGTSESINTANGKYYFHIGLFGGLEKATLNNIKTVRVDFAGKKASVTGTMAPQVHLLADAMKVMNGSTVVSVAATPVVMASDYSKNVADNYINMFSLDHIHAN
ncbi:MbnP family protein [Dyadobacter tibetensis]|uniref:MbnP family protein n=1 Tax=Dyadobacter tibetensis TaxID=1211851 RepID=UPI000470C66D|nr:MbnP family protein [Dyadobacter tibetensis]